MDFTQCEVRPLILIYAINTDRFLCISISRWLHVPPFIGLTFDLGIGTLFCLVLWQASHVLNHIHSQSQTNQIFSDTFSQDHKCYVEMGIFANI